MLKLAVSRRYVIPAHHIHKLTTSCSVFRNQMYAPVCFHAVAGGFLMVKEQRALSEAMLKAVKRACTVALLSPRL